MLAAHVRQHPPHRIVNRDNTPWGPTPAADLQWTAAGEPWSGRFQDIYFSREDGAAESRHVFLAGNQLPQRWQDWPGERFCIAETGFGTGLNFLLTWQAWRTLPTPRPRLHYISVERYPLAREELQRALVAWPDLGELAAALIAYWPGRLPGQHRLVLEDGAVLLDLWWEDVAQALPDLASHGPQVDAWYLDGFAPARNEAMWSATLFPAIAALSRPGTTCATFTAAGEVRRGLAAAGFDMHKFPGYGRKRESLGGVLSSAAPAPPLRATPWDLPDTPTDPAASALVLGAGLAGCSVARALARRGLAVTVLERGAIAGAASGNPQGILYTRLSRRHAALTDFALQSFRHASSHYAGMFARAELHTGEDGELCGMFHLEEDADEFAALSAALTGLEDLAAGLTPGQAEQHLGLATALPGFWFLGSGWLRPTALCRALLEHPGIQVRSNCGELALAHEGGQWRARDAHGKLVGEAPVAVICAGHTSLSQAGLDWLPLREMPGQTTQLPASAASSTLRAAVCHRGYIAPAAGGEHCIGATFRPRERNVELRPSEHRENLDNLAAALPQWQPWLDALPAAELHGRVGIRCTSPDYLPLCGPAPEREAFLHAYAGLRKNARQIIAQRGPYMPGLYVNTAHGARGLSSTPLCAELLASQICAEAPPVSRELSRALSPARFLVRDLSRNRA
ncbi:bifunctional tRNA (5-methylaminomethyl-2-thiouridine)(34)-methyltransferase MnmD/FAD-dependent 5-carboxymethylaminomethyl-2-thiouridine(34) oxidoreductase MnmC [Mangrovimicrobium sediminis]|uniref:tRNA 5-methylaminomethyl-2-thiouridine biosynthesis bifunctional protein MnmC n=1 Tax=Mangrovimicrobium sediminis TaxID=2562682 RepID=A0A4Z0M9H9_9GAMM|nr:bifunctional tRNA (5-methylaminomethyl-2-thiouridine)(34)-methyltransferase MnmD/FAD-dependent 5-carboxymethylaminomethyl-2-thiouridine(34) oxidoreductase MnmC [Haliea sp. SAOS-164]TGD76027.1 bifunctional tRNA (5-methylaminomethyl-2-thiouridine)(34)-methyltransferase MnmD/FAD-dependent 5-carboxymethylaminomethyl-2-thiouridine(34) oxidoreductase MnmC [Haliea sp. SAOS-164]